MKNLNQGKFARQKYAHAANLPKNVPINDTTIFMHGCKALYHNRIQKQIRFPYGLLAAPACNSGGGFFMPLKPLKGVFAGSGVAYSCNVWQKNGTTADTTKYLSPCKIPE